MFLFKKNRAQEERLKSRNLEHEAKTDDEKWDLLGDEMEPETFMDTIDDLDEEDDLFF